MSICISSCRYISAVQFLRVPIVNQVGYLHEEHDWTGWVSLGRGCLVPSPATMIIDEISSIVVKKSVKK